MNSYCPMIVMACMSAACAAATPSSAENSAREPERARAAPSSSPHSHEAEQRAVVDFWRAAGPSLWFAKDPQFDRRFRERFLPLHERAARAQLSTWADTPIGALALLLLLDQFPRNAFRGTARMYATDELARAITHQALAAGHDRSIEPELRLFVYLPLGHSEDLLDQERSVELARALGQPNLAHAERHRDIIRRFGRFPHRNPILGRKMTSAEQQYLDGGGFAG